MRWLELSPNFRCNLRCVGCLPESGDVPTDDLTGEQVLSWLRRGRAEGATGLWLGGGEPTLRRDLLALVNAARRLGYTEIKLQTNGLVLAYPDVTRRLVEAGLTTVSLALRSAEAEVHDALVRRPGAWAGLEQALAVLRGHPGLTLEGDVLLSRSNAPGLPATIEAYAARGVSAFSIWLLCRLIDDEATRRELVPFAEVMPSLVEAVARADARGVRLTSLHTPACVVPPEVRGHLYYPPELDLLVVNADGRSFWLEESPMEGGAPLPSCERCAWRPRCLGPRADYLDVFGPTEFVPIER